MLVTGASGFVGSAVAQMFACQGVAVRMLVRAQSARKNIDDIDGDVVLGDLNDPSSLAAAVAGCDGLLHVAADYRLWTRDVDAMYQTNVTGTLALIRQAVEAGVQRVVYTSSVATLGLRSDQRPGDENTPVHYDQMVGHYKRSKFLAEALVMQQVRAHGWPVVVVNPSTPIGPRDLKPTPTGRVVLDAARGRMPAFVDTGLNVVHVDDVARGHWLAYQRGRVGERYILGGEDWPLAQILSVVARHCGRSPPRLRLPHAAVMPIALGCELWARCFGGEPMATVDGIRMARKHMYFSSDKARCELDYSPRPAVQAIVDAIEWFRHAGYLQR